MASTFFSLENLLSPVFNSELAAIKPNIACNLDSSPWESVAFFAFEEVMTPSGEVTFDFCSILDIRFGVGAFSSQKLVFADFTRLREGSFVDMLTMLRILPRVLAFSRGFLTVWSLWANDTFFGWHPFLFSRLLCAMLLSPGVESELEGMQSWLPCMYYL